MKADDAEIPEYLWDQVLVPCLDPLRKRALTNFRDLGMRWWKSRIRKEFLTWFFNEHPGLKETLQVSKESYTQYIGVIHGFLKRSKEASKNWTAGRDCVSRCCNSTWWEWSAGSRPRFWRWPSEYRSQIRDGVPPWFSSTPPKWQVPQRLEKNPQVR